MDRQNIILKHWDLLSECKSATTVQLSTLTVDVSTLMIDVSTLTVDVSMLTVDVRVRSTVDLLMF
jgi:hypothetical protein